MESSSSRALFARQKKKSIQHRSFDTRVSSSHCSQLQSKLAHDFILRAMMTYPHEFGLIAFLLHRHCGAIGNVLQPIVSSIIQRFPYLILPGIIWHRVVGLQKKLFLINLYRMNSYI